MSVEQLLVDSRLSEHSSGDEQRRTRYYSGYPKSQRRSQRDAVGQNETNESRRFRGSSREQSPECIVRNVARDARNAGQNGAPPPEQEGPARVRQSMPEAIVQQYSSLREPHERCERTNANANANPRMQEQQPAPPLRQLSVNNQPPSAAFESNSSIV